MDPNEVGLGYGVPTMELSKDEASSALEPVRPMSSFCQLDNRHQAAPSASHKQSCLDVASTQDDLQLVLDQR